MRWFLPWTLAVMTAAATAGSALATVSPAWRGSERGPAGGEGLEGGRGEARGEEGGCLGSAASGRARSRGSTCRNTLVGPARLLSHLKPQGREGARSQGPGSRPGVAETGCVVLG